MVRLISAVLLLGWVVPSLAQTPKESDSAAQAPAATQGPGQAAADQNAAAPAKSQYPLDSFTEFSAIMVGTSMDIDGGTDEAHIYRSGKLMRTQGPVLDYFITDLSTRETFGVTASSCVHDARLYVRVSPFGAATPDSKVERVAAGKETLDGHSCQIEDVTVSSPKRSNPLKMRFWEAEDLQGFPIKIDVHRGNKIATIRYKNVVLGPQDPTLFIHPKSCGPVVEGAPAKLKAPPAAKKPAAAPQQ
jgi:hypothetical protein